MQHSSHAHATHKPAAPAPAAHKPSPAPTAAKRGEDTTFKFNGTKRAAGPAIDTSVLPDSLKPTVHAAVEWLPGHSCDIDVSWKMVDAKPAEATVTVRSK